MSLFSVPSIAAESRLLKITINGVGRFEYEREGSEIRFYALPPRISTHCGNCNGTGLQDYMDYCRQCGGKGEVTPYPMDKTCKDMTMDASELIYRCTRQLNTELGEGWGNDDFNGLIETHIEEFIHANAERMTLWV